MLELDFTKIWSPKELINQLNSFVCTVCKCKHWYDAGTNGFNNYLVSCYHCEYFLKFETYNDKRSTNMFTNRADDCWQLQSFTIKNFHNKINIIFTRIDGAVSAIISYPHDITPYGQDNKYLFKIINKKIIDFPCILNKENLQEIKEYMCKYSVLI